MPKFAKDVGPYEVGELIEALKKFPKKLKVLICTSPIFFREVEGQPTALGRCRPLLNLQAGSFNAERSILNFVVPDDEDGEVADTLCLFPSETTDGEPSSRASSEQALVVSSPIEAPTQPSRKHQPLPKRRSHGKNEFTDGGFW